MKKFRTLALITLILVLSMAFVKPIQSQEPSYFTIVKTYWGTTQPIEVSPGDAATLTVVLRYELTLSLKSLEANLFLPEGFKAVGGGNKSTAYYTGSISLGSIVNLGFPIFITPKAVKGNYTTDLEVTKYYVSTLTVSKEVLKVAFEVTGKPSVDAKALNSSLREGRQQIRIALYNEGDAVAEYLKITKVYTSGALVELEGNTFFDKLEPGDNITIPLRIYVPTGMKGILSITIEGSCVGPRSVPYLFSKTISLSVRSSTVMPALELNVEPKELIIGKSSKVYLELKNIGSHVLSEIELVASPDAILKFFGKSTLYIDRLEPGEKGQIYTEIYVPATTTAPTASLTLTVTYYDEDLGIAQSDDQKLNMLLRGLIEISLTDRAVIPSTPRPGSPFSITVTVTNVGTSSASAAYAIPMIEGLPVKPFGPISVYIGNIEINLPTTFTLNLQLEDTAENVITLPVVLIYMDNLRTLHNITFTIPINVAPKTSTSSQTSQGGLEILGPRPVLTIVILSGVSATIIVVFIIVIKRMRRER